MENSIKRCEYCIDNWHKQAICSYSLKKILLAEDRLANIGFESIKRGEAIDSVMDRQIIISTDIKDRIYHLLGLAGCTLTREELDKNVLSLRSKS